MHPYIILPILAQLTSLALGVVVFLKDPKGKINRIFILFTLTGTFWSLSNFLADSLKDYKEVIFWSKMTIVGPVLMAAFFLYLSFIFPNEGKKSRGLKFLFFICLPCIIFFIFTPSVFNIKDVKIQQWGAEIVPGPLYYFLFFYLVVYYGIALKNLWIKYKASLTENEKHQISYFFCGIILAIIIGIFTNLIFPLFNWGYPSKIGPPFAIFTFTFFTSYAILKYRLFEIRIVLTSLLVGVIAILLSANIIDSKTNFEYVWKAALLMAFLLFGYLLIKSVLNEIKRREEVQRLYEEVGKLSKAKSEFISIASHQLRTPLTAIKGYLSMILEKTYGEVPEKIERPLKNVSLSNERLIKLVNDLLNISRIEAGRMEIKMENLSVEDIIASVVEELKSIVKEKNLYLKFEKPKIALPKILIDGDKIRQVILNLTDNAIKYTNRGGITIKSEISTENQDKIIIEVSDTGEGMTKEEMSKMFESFSRGSAGTRLYTEGAGLGLYIAKKFVEMHKGRIWAESQGRGKGSALYIELPIV
jgi:signal transduction histidine kinase